jgi:hypothetical protein
MPSAAAYGMQPSAALYHQPNEDLKKLDNQLFDLLRSNEPAPRIPSATGRTAPSSIPHINRNNSMQRIQQMRDSRDHFIAPKMG